MWKTVEAKAKENWDSKKQKKGKTIEIKKIAKQW